MTESERFSKLVTGLLRVPHSELKKELDKEKQQRQQKRKKRAKVSPASHGPAA